MGRKIGAYGRSDRIDKMDKMGEKEDKNPVNRVNPVQPSDAGPQKGDFIAPPEIEERDERADALPAQEEFWRPPTRFGSVPVEKEPLGWDRRRGFRKLFPQVMLPFQVVERVTFGHGSAGVPPAGSGTCFQPVNHGQDGRATSNHGQDAHATSHNRLFWGDNLHVMRQLPSESIDLIYIDPPFFSGKQYNVIFGDQNELRSFSDIWEGGMPGYLIWLNARLYEMKRLLKKTGSIYVHCDWHASHYIKAELDKILGNDRFLNEVIWHYGARATVAEGRFQRKHDCLFVYTKTDQYGFTQLFNEYPESSAKQYDQTDEKGRYKLCTRRRTDGTKYRAKCYMGEGSPMTDVWDIQIIPPRDKERIGYPTQKPEVLLERIIQASSNEGDVVADFFCGGGTTAAVAQRLGRRWIACDQSRVAVAITADRLTRQVEEQTGRLFPVPDFTIEHWGVYEARRLADAPPDQFRAFVLKCFGAVEEIDRIDKMDKIGKQNLVNPVNPVKDNPVQNIHGYKGAIPVWVGEPDQKKAVTAKDVQAFANAMRKTLRYKQDNLRDGIMLAWAFRPDGQEAAERLRQLEQTDLNFIRLDMIRIDSPRFREHVVSLSTEKADYANFLTFVQPPKIEAIFKRIAPRTFKFDVSETVILNAGAKIINVQWDFDYGKRFSSTPGHSFARGSKKEPALQAQYEFPTAGKKRIACKVQDDMGGEGLWTAEIEVE